jgi:hypothetical protein
MGQSYSLEYFWDWLASLTLWVMATQITTTLAAISVFPVTISPSSKADQSKVSNDCTS